MACAISYSKKVAISKLLEIAWVAYLGRITNIGSGHAQKLLMERSGESRDISVRDKLLEKVCRTRIVQNRMGSIFKPNNEYLKRSHAKIIKGALPGGPRC